MSDIDSTPYWQDDSTVTSCFLCEIPFTFLNRRHHCRKCGRIVCGSCSSQVVRYFPHALVVTPTGNSRYNPMETHRTCDACVEEIRMIRRALLVPEENNSWSSLTDHSTDRADFNSVTKYSNTRFTTNLVNSSTSSVIPEDTSDHNLCPICATNLVDVYVKAHKKSISEISGDDFEAFKEDHINDCLTSYDFDSNHARFSAAALKHPRNKMLVYNMPPIPQPRFEPIPGTSSINIPGTGTSNVPINSVETVGPQSVDTVKETFGSVSSSIANEKLEDDNECVICLEELKPGDKVGRLECLCVFHYKCIKDWFNKKGYGECPVHHLLR